MNIVEKAFTLLYPEKQLDKEMSIKYSRRFSDYNANVRLKNNHLLFHFSKKWKEIDQDIRMGLIQELLVKVYKDKRKTFQMKLYNTFIKNVHLAIPKDNVDPILLESFNRMNEKYFQGMVEMPNLVWGTNSKSTLGNYNFHTDTIKLSSIFKNYPTFIDLVIHHEMLHKHLKFYNTKSKSMFHSPQFRRLEKEFENFEEVERKLKRFLAKERIKSFFWS
tara:strand:- start:2901 stop:3557 length:657 start_codon:yes stop_codon:yes gene_type:complete